MKRFIKKFFPFGWGNISKLTLIYFFSTLYFYIPVATLYLQGKGLNYVMINSLWGIIVATMFLAEIPTGMIADRIGHKKSIILALGLQLTGEILFVFINSYSLFVLTAVIGGIGFAFSSGCIEALVMNELNQRETMDTAGQKNSNEMTRAMGLIQSAPQLASLIAFAAGGLIVINLSETQFVIAIIMTALCVGIGFLLTFSLQERQHEQQEEAGPNSFQLLKDGFHLLRKNKVFLGLVLLSLFTVPFRDYLLNLYPLKFLDAGVPSLWLGLGLALASGLGIIAARYSYWLEEKVGSKTALLISTLLPGLLYFPFAFLANGNLIVLTFCLLLGTQSLRNPILSAQINLHISDHNRATVLSIISMFSGAYVSLIGLLIGWTADQSLTAAFVLMGALITLGTLLFSTRKENKTV